MSGKTVLELTDIQQDALKVSSDNADAFIVDPETQDVMWLHDYAGDEDPKEIFYCGKIYRCED